MIDFSYNSFPYDFAFLVASYDPDDETITIMSNDEYWYDTLVNVAASEAARRMTVYVTSQIDALYRKLDLPARLPVHF